MMNSLKEDTSFRAYTNVGYENYTLSLNKDPYFNEVCVQGLGLVVVGEEERSQGASQG